MVKHRNLQKGFTLIEIVVAIAIFAVIASIIFPALMQFLDMRERVDRKHDELMGLQKTFQFLANDLRYAANRTSKNEYGDRAKTTLSLNEGSLIEFTAIYPDLTIKGLNVPRRVLWRLEDGQLQRVQYSVMDPDSESGIILQKLLDDVAEVEIEVRYVENGRDNKDDKWRELTRLPDMVEVVIELKNNIRYRRLFSMQGGDNATALKATQVPVAGDNPVDDGPPSPDSDS